MPPIDRPFDKDYLCRFFENIHKPCLKEFSDDPANVRKAFCAAWSIDAVASHIHEHLKQCDQDYQYKNKKDGFLKSRLGEENSDFQIAFEVSKAGKHAQLEQNPKIVRSSHELAVYRVEGYLAYFLNEKEYGDYVLLTDGEYPVKIFLRICEGASAFMEEKYKLNLRET